MWTSYFFTFSCHHPHNQCYINRELCLQLAYTVHTTSTNSIIYFPCNLLCSKASGNEKSQVHVNTNLSKTWTSVMAGSHVAACKHSHWRKLCLYNTWQDCLNIFPSKLGAKNQVLAVVQQIDTAAVCGRKLPVLFHSSFTHHTPYLSKITFLMCSFIKCTVLVTHIASQAISLES